jgi:hypothetical protein
MTERAKMHTAMYMAGFRRFELKGTDIHCDMKIGGVEMLALKLPEGVV